ncbi:hypothetical protein LINPERPRIM_LOCUS25460 [Linum perenne]
MALRTPPTSLKPCGSLVRAPSLSRRQRLPPSSLLLVPGNQTKSCVSLKLPADGLIRLPSKTLSNEKFSPRVPKFSKSLSPVCLHAGMDRPERDNQGFSWESFDNTRGSYKAKSVEELLREQMRKEFYGGGSGKNSPGGGGGSRGGGGGGRGGSGGEGEERRKFGVTDEALQVIFATIGFIFVYFYVINGVEMTHLAKDYINFLWTGTKSVRLKKSMRKWAIFLQTLLDKKEVFKCRLEKGIIDAANWLFARAKFRQRLRSYLTSNADH